MLCSIFQATRKNEANNKNSIVKKRQNCAKSQLHAKQRLNLSNKQQKISQFYNFFHYDVLKEKTILSIVIIT